MKLRLKIRRLKELKVFDSLSLSIVVATEILAEIAAEILGRIEVLAEVLTEILVEILAKIFKVEASLVVYYLGFSIS